MGLIQSLLRGNGINQNSLFTEVMLKTGGYGGEKVKGGDRSGGVLGSRNKMSLLSSVRPHVIKI